MLLEKPSGIADPTTEGARGQAAFAPALACAKAVGGYAWWYAEVHGLRAGGRRYSLTLILFVGSVFSPTYAQRLRRGDGATGFDFPAVNLALYEHLDDAGGGRAGRILQRAWVMSEHSPSELSTTDFGLRCGRSGIQHLHDGSTVIDLDEETTRFFGRAGTRLSARIVLSPPLLPGSPLELGRGPGDGGVHYWQPLAPRALATVSLRCGELELKSPGLAYCDRNFGSGRMEDAFRRWCWAHGSAESAGSDDSATTTGETALVLYDAERRDGGRTLLAVRCAGQGQPPTVERQNQPTQPTLPSRSGGGLLWLRAPLEFGTCGYRCERLVDEVLLDAPFYSRFGVRLVGPPGSGPALHGVGEYLDLERFSSRAVQHLLRYKTRRVGP